MTKIRTQRETLAYYEEGSYGQLPESPSGFWLVPSSDGLERSAENYAFHALRDGYLKSASLRHLKTGGTIRAKVYPDIYFDLLKAVMRGKVSTSGEGLYTHQVETDNRDHSFTFERSVLDISKYLKYNGCRIIESSISFPKSGFVEAAHQVVGSNEIESDSVISEELDRSSELPYAAEEAMLYIEEEEEPTFIEGSLSISVASSIGRFSPATQVAEEVWTGTVKSTGRISLFAESLDKLSYLADQASRSMEIVLQRGDYSASFLIENAVIIAVTPPFISSRGCYAQVIELEGRDPPVKMVVVNDRSTI
jgi:hypothetical protein